MSAFANTECSPAPPSSTGLTPPEVSTVRERALAITANQRWRAYANLLIYENRWRAQRYGLDGGLIDFGRGQVVPYPQLLDELLGFVMEDAEFFGCTPELEHVLEICRRGTGADRQAARYEALLKLGELRDKGLISDEEFEAEKAKLLSGDE